MNSNQIFLDTNELGIDSNLSKTTSKEIISLYKYQRTIVRKDSNKITLHEESLVMKTIRTVPKLGVMLVGWGGNNGSTVTAGILANRLDLKWNTKDGTFSSDYLGSMTQSSTVRIGTNEDGKFVNIPFKNLLPMVSPNDMIIGGWDICGDNLAIAMKKAKVLDFDLQRQLIPHMEKLVPLPSIYSPCFIAANQSDRANNILRGSKAEQLKTIRKDIQNFKEQNQLDKVIVLWTANTEKFCDVKIGLNDTSQALFDSITNDEEEVSPSTLFAVASILEGCSYINGSPQNTFVPGVIQLAEERNVFIAGDDFKTGQTKMKSVLVDYLVSAGIKPTSIVSYNHLGNNDGKNLSAPDQFRSKEISKSNVVDDMVASNRILYAEAEHPDHCVVIKYVPSVGDSKRAMDEYTSSIFMNGKNTIVMHNTCEDSLLATPIILDLIILCELCERIKMRRLPPTQPIGGYNLDSILQDDDESQYERFHCVLSILSYLLKAPMVPHSTPVVNALNAQRLSIINIFRACRGLPPDNFMHLEHKIPSMIYNHGVVVGSSGNKRKVENNSHLGHDLHPEREDVNSEANSLTSNSDSECLDPATARIE